MHRVLQKPHTCVCVEGHVHDPEPSGLALWPMLPSPTHHSGPASRAPQDLAGSSCVQMERTSEGLAHLVEEGEFLQCAIFPHSSNGQVFVASELHLLLRRETLGLMVCPHHKDQGCMEPGEASNVVSRTLSWAPLVYLAVQHQGACCLLPPWPCVRWVPNSGPKERQSPQQHPIRSSARTWC